MTSFQFNVLDELVTRQQTGCPHNWLHACFGMTGRYRWRYLQELRAAGLVAHEYHGLYHITERGKIAWAIETGIRKRRERKLKAAA